MSVYCEATLNYSVGLEVFPTKVTVRNGRDEGPFALEEHGFELRRHASVIEDWNEAAGPDSPHYAEIGALAREFTGCNAVLFYPGLLRNREMAERSPDLAPVHFVHSDYTESYRAMLEDEGHPYRGILAPSMEAAGVTGDDLAAARRIVTLQFWRNIGPPVMDCPLAFCDARTVARDTMQPILVPEYGGIATGFQSFQVGPPDDPEAHHWYTFPALAADEVVVFRAYDSERAEAGEPFWAPHTAFADPTVPQDAPWRESLEMRAICLDLA